MESIAAGAAVGLIECAVCQPFDMVKTRHHLSSQARSVASSLQAIHAEGGFRRFYRGVGPEFAGMVPKSAAMYSSYDGARQLLLAHTSLDEVAASVAAGAASGPFEAAVVQPFQVVKVRMQTKEYAQMLRSEGVAAFARTGLGATVWRSFGCGVLATCFNAPFDVAKSRIQSQLPAATAGATGDSHRRYHGTLSTLARIAREEGLAACWKGFQAKAIRMGLAGLVGLSSFDLVKWLLEALL
ncbi:hypothetical protein EMIHUDRAFT_195091 [Emiliania huxleyi CCMP1516]|uniref:Uncharacterized protein n=2 Tax=Emiliania huxleyi TaxID=2903 RepID=A0A0D3JGW2_EMIH1|nr:hypothetical protein EMIHUDRAFT_195091 [Emiliania huxleyi CCMP1516]EOD22747.1 hypothetical protein EMIHUDRAFT_195091 [Emiliania huxleyi CCMP1516]|eukprot:XP_005775176.1 hypothetical protein EMIHUDRAFT_195091 [Emiliania huxleyi CCMP1516]